MKLVLLVILSACFSGCSDQWVLTSDLNALKRPVIVISTGDGNILLKGSDGQIYLAKSETYLGSSLKNTKPGDVIIP